MGGIDPRRSSNLFHGSRSCGSNLLPSEWLLLLASREGMYYTLFKKKQSFFFFRPFPLKKKQIHGIFKRDRSFSNFWEGGNLTFIRQNCIHCGSTHHSPLTTTEGSSRDQTLHQHPGCLHDVSRMKMLGGKPLKMGARKKNQLPGTPPATIVLKIGHLAFQVHIHLISKKRAPTGEVKQFHPKGYSGL